MGKIRLKMNSSPSPSPLLGFHDLHLSYMKKKKMGNEPDGSKIVVVMTMVSSFNKILKSYCKSWASFLTTVRDNTN